MRYFRVSVEGRNFIFNSEKGLERLGFFTTRYVKARDERESKDAALNMIRNDESLAASILNKNNEAAELYVDHIEELASFEGINVPGAGYSLYPMNREG